MFNIGDIVVNNVDIKNRNKTVFAGTRGVVTKILSGNTYAVEFKYRHRRFIARAKSIELVAVMEKALTPEQAEANKITFMHEAQFYAGVAERVLHHKDFMFVDDVDREKFAKILMIIASEYQKDIVGTAV